MAEPLEAESTNFLAVSSICSNKNESLHSHVGYFTSFKQYYQCKGAFSKFTVLAPDVQAQLTSPCTGMK